MIYNRLHCVVPQIMSDWYGVDGLLIVWVLCVCVVNLKTFVSCLILLETWKHSTQPEHCRRGWRCHVFMFKWHTNLHPF